jgi:hypothetical protein
MPKAICSFSLRHRDLKTQGAYALIAWAIQYQWQAGTKIMSIADLEIEFEKQFNQKIQILKTKAIEALKNNKHTEFVRHAALHLALEEFEMPLYAEHMSEDFHLQWVGRQYAYQRFSKFLPKTMTNSIGAPKLERNIDTRRDDFVFETQSCFMSWAYKLYNKASSELKFPVQINLEPNQLNSAQSIIIEFMNRNEMNDLYKMMIRNFRGPLLRELQDLYTDRHEKKNVNEAPAIWRTLNKEITLIQGESWVSSDTINQSLSMGKAARLKSKVSNYVSNQKLPHFADKKWKSDEMFLGQKSLIF